MKTPPKKTIPMQMLLHHSQDALMNRTFASWPIGLDFPGELGYLHLHLDANSLDFIELKLPSH
jgi:hypothetical protein